MPLDYGRGFPGDPLFLHVRNEEFVGEVAKMGHGLQMWLQTMWFLTRARDASTLILDERTPPFNLLSKPASTQPENKW